MSRYTYDKTSKELDIIAGVPAMDSTPVEDSIKPITSGGVYDVVDEFTQINNNLGVKNLLGCDNTNGTYGGVDFTINDDGSITANGTSNFLIGWRIQDIKSNIIAGEHYVLTGCPSGGSMDGYRLACAVKQSDSTIINWSYDIGNGVDLPVLEEGQHYTIVIQISNGVTVNNITFYPMLRPAYITDGTYEPYARSNQELTGEVESMLNVLGAKNLLPNNYAVTSTVNGITYTVNSDGTITANGTATANADLALLPSVYQQYMHLVDGVIYKLTGCPPQADPSDPKFQIIYGQIVDAWQWSSDVGDGALFEAHGNRTRDYALLRIYSGTTVSNLTFKPMIRPASIKDNTYVPYAMTNRELTKSSKWKYLGQSTGTTYIYLPSDFSEIQVDVSITSTRFATYHIIKNQLSSSEKRFISGTYFSANDNNGCSIGCTTNYVGLLYAYSNGTDKTSTATMTVYYK